MKKRLLIITAALLAAGITTQNYGVKDVTVAKAIKKGGEWIGIGTGAAAGYLGAQEVAKRIDPQTIKGALGVGLVAGASVGTGAEIGKYLGENAAVLYLSKKHNVGKRIALASLIANRELNDETKALFDAATRKDKEFLTGFFATYYSNIFGPQWQNIVSTLINKALGFKIAPILRLGWDVGKQAVQFYKTTPLSYAISILYFDQSFPAREADRGATTRVKATKKLFDALFGTMQAEIPKPR